MLVPDGVSALGRPGVPCPVPTSAELGLMPEQPPSPVAADLSLRSSWDPGPEGLLSLPLGRGAYCHRPVGLRDSPGLWGWGSPAPSGLNLLLPKKSIPASRSGLVPMSLPEWALRLAPRGRRPPVFQDPPPSFSYAPGKGHGRNLWVRQVPDAKGSQLFPADGLGHARW